MQYDHILIRYGELGLKGKNINTFLVRLQQNIQQALIKYQNIKVKRTQGRLIILLNGHDPDDIIEICQDIFGIQSLSLAIKIENDETQIKETSAKLLSEEKDSETFKVNTKRAFKEFPVDSLQMNHSLVVLILCELRHFSVNVDESDYELLLEIRYDSNSLLLTHF